MRYVFCLLLLLCFATPASAQFVGPGAQEKVTEVQAILDNPSDDQPVMLRGRILERVGDEKYLFTDGTAQIRIEIDDEVFPSQRITPEMEVEIYGEVEKDFLQDPEVDVERMTVPGVGSADTTGTGGAGFGQ